MRLDDNAHIISNNPIEDAHADYVAPVPNGYWSMFAIFDGHSGWETSTWLRDNLLAAVTGSLADLYDRIKTASETLTASPTPADIEATLKGTFKEVDDQLVYSALELAMSDSSKYKAINVLAPAYAGSCALVSVYDSDSRLLHVALTGDSRAVLGRRVVDVSGETTHYEVHQLSIDQNGYNAAEKYRLLAQHPGEAIVKDGRVLGWGVSRAFGDARMKWSRDVQKYLKATLLGRSVASNVKTPPYFTAEPEVTSIKIQPGDFLIMASDGLWEALTNEEAVGLVAWWLRAGGASPDKPVLPPPELPVRFPDDYADTTGRYSQWNASKEFINTDDNVATHLVRNAMGGADEDLVAALLSMVSPRARNYHDDITATVIFFD
ncbi:protein serine/threonine phosphatase 2C [Trametopsis cervina]|nr:protein serine/threonine phosphatase 2C [Trametopsis cervina]